MIRNILLYLLCLLTLPAFSQTKEIDCSYSYGEKRLCGIIHLQSKKWLTPKTYIDIEEIKYYNDSSSQYQTIYYVAKNDKGKIIIDSNGTTKLSPIFQEIRSIQDNADLFIVKINGLYGIYSLKSKKMNAPAKYLSLSRTNAHRYLIAKTKTGVQLLNENGTKNISAEFDKISETTEKHDLFVVETKGQKNLFIPGKGIVKSAGSFDTYSLGYQSDYVTLKKENKYAFFSIPEMNCTSFDYDNYSEEWHKYLIAKKNGKYGMLDTLGKTSIPFVYDAIQPENSHFCNFLFVQLNNKWGAVNEKGEVLIPYKYENIDIKNISSLISYTGQCPKFIPVKENGKWGVINLQQEYIIKSEFDTLLYINSPLFDTLRNQLTPISFCFLKNGKQGTIDENNKVIFPFNYTYFEKINEEMGRSLGPKLYLINNGCKICDVYETEGNWGLADSSGNIITEPNASIISLLNYDFSYERNNPMYYGTAEEKIKWMQKADSTAIGFLWNIGGRKIKNLLSVNRDSVDYANFDEDGNEYYTKVEMTDSLFSYNIVGGKTGVIDPWGKIIIPIEYEDFSFVTYNSRKWHGEGGVSIVPSLSSISEVYENTYTLKGLQPYFAKRNGKWGYYAWPNKEIIAPSFDSINRMAIDNGWLYEFGDSIVSALGYHKEILQAYEKKNIYYYSLKGKLLFKQLGNECASSYITLKSESKDQAPKLNDFNQYLVITINSKPKAFFHEERYMEYENYDSYGNNTPYEKVITHEYITEHGGTFNLLHSGTFKFLFKEPVEDLRLVVSKEFINESAPGILKWSDLTNRMRFLFKQPGFKEVPLEASKADRTNLPQIGIFDPKIFFKEKGKWYFQNMKDTVASNAATGFDSIEFRTENTYKAFLNGKSAFFNYDHKGPFVFEIELRFPDYQGNYNLVCKEGKYRYKTIYQEREEQIVNEYGEVMESKWITDTVKIPFVEKGFFNITDSADNIVLNKWYDEILFPVTNAGDQFSLTDTNSFVYHPQRFQNRDFSEYLRRCTMTLAAKDGNNWQLIDLKTKEKTIDGFESIKAQNGSWIATKNGKKYKYNIYNIWDAPEILEE
ncbi:MAG: WG repeat-containing protein [Bacteroidota bacterium]|nr:WG repeat-containing protein [Bacteroidota bacterium]